MASSTTQAAARLRRDTADGQEVARPLPGRRRGGAGRRLVKASALARGDRPAKALLIVELRTASDDPVADRPAASASLSPRSAGSWLGPDSPNSATSSRPSRRAIRARGAGDLLHIDTKKLGRIVRPVTRDGDRRRCRGAGWEMLFVAIDDHARLAFTAMHPDEKKEQAVAFLRAPLPTTPSSGSRSASADRQRLGVPIQRVCSRLRSTRHQPQVHAALPPADQRQGRAIHPVSASRMGLRLDVSELGSSSQSSCQLAAPLQLPSTPQRHRRGAAHLQAQLFKGQPLDASHLAGPGSSRAHPNATSSAFAIWDVRPG